jgi:hypothetical protein
MDDDTGTTSEEQLYGCGGGGGDDDEKNDEGMTLSRESRWLIPSEQKTMIPTMTLVPVAPPPRDDTSLRTDSNPHQI